MGANFFNAKLTDFSSIQVELRFTSRSSKIFWITKKPDLDINIRSASNFPSVGTYNDDQGYLLNIKCDKEYLLSIQCHQEYLRNIQCDKGYSMDRQKSRIKRLSLDTPITQLRESLSSKNNSGVTICSAVNIRMQSFRSNLTDMTKNK